jgi:hypothetical protein
MLIYILMFARLSRMWHVSKLKCKYYICWKLNFKQCTPNSHVENPHQDGKTHVYSLSTFLNECISSIRIFINSQKTIFFTDVVPFVMSAFRFSL